MALHNLLFNQTHISILTILWHDTALITLHNCLDWQGKDQSKETNSKQQNINFPNAKKKIHVTNANGIRTNCQHQMLLLRYKISILYDKGVNFNDGAYGKLIT